METLDFFFKETEITPQGAFGIFRFNEKDELVKSFPSEVEVRAVIEGQFLSMRYHSSNIGISKIERVFITGGASYNPFIVQVVADVFGVNVYVAETANSASLGAAYRALHGWLSHINKKFISFEEVTSKATPCNQIAQPSTEAHSIYTKMLERYKNLEKLILEGKILLV